MKIIKTITKILLIAGLLIMIGAAGHSDYCFETGQVYPLTDMIFTECMGVALCIPFFVIELGAEDDHGGDNE